MSHTPCYIFAHQRENVQPKIFNFLNLFNFLLSNENVEQVISLHKHGMSTEDRLFHPSDNVSVPYVLVAPLPDRSPFCVLAC